MVLRNRPNVPQSQRTPQNIGVLLFTLVRKGRRPSQLYSRLRGRHLALSQHVPVHTFSQRVVRIISRTVPPHGFNVEVRICAHLPWQLLWMLAESTLIAHACANICMLTRRHARDRQSCMHVCIYVCMCVYMCEYVYTFV